MARALLGLAREEREDVGLLLRCGAVAAIATVAIITMRRFILGCPFWVEIVS